MKGKPTTIRLTQEAMTLLADMASKRGISKTAMLEILIRENAKKDRKEYRVRECPKCGNTDDQKHIYAVLNDTVKTPDGDIRIAGCSCSACNYAWTEYAYPDGDVEVYNIGDEPHTHNPDTRQWLP